MPVETARMQQAAEHAPIVNAAMTPIMNSSFERRRETRYPTLDVVEVCILDAGRQRFAAFIRDVSRNGLRLELSVPLTTGTRLEIILHNRAIIFGESRYCRRNDNSYHVGVVIEDVYYATPVGDRHIEDDQLGLYVAGKGLGVLDVIHIRNHLVACKECRGHLANAATLWKPAKKSTSIGQ